ncbi:MAG TPA: ABC transporter permease [Blastocatellia bacterium]|jgi:predicted permease|nr:ABC transporter permease [Blastocatellia bacterium]
MFKRRKDGLMKLPLWLIRVTGVIVPRRLRADWRQEWEAELRYRESQLAEWDRLDWRNKLDLLWRSLGAFWDALLLQPRRLEDEMFQDLRFGLRMLRKNPGFTSVAVFTLALGIGANTAIFSVVNGVLLKPLPYPEPERLVRVFQNIMNFPKAPMSPADFRDYREQNTTFESLAGYFRQDLELAQEEKAERLMGMRASSGYFQTLGLEPMLGREFTHEEEIPDESAVVILSHGLWQRRFDGDPKIVGKTIRLSGKSFTVVGVAPAGLQHVGGGYRPLPHGESVDIWWPMRLGPNRPRGALIVNVIGRLKPGVTRQQAEAEFDLIAARLAEQYPGPYRKAKTITQPLREEIVEGSQRALLLLLAAVFFVLLIACVNVANLTLARAAAREREIAVRLALGAGRARILRQLLIESLTLAVIGGLLGLLLAKLAINALIKLGPEQLPRLHMINLDMRILAFTLLISLLTGLLFGMAPALQSLKLNLNESLKEGGRAATSGRRQRRTRGALVVAEVALALALLLGAGLLMRSFLKLQQTDPGFNPSGVLTMSVVLPGARYVGVEPQISFLQRLVERVSALPGVRSAGVTSDLPWTGYQNEAGLRVEGKTFPTDQEPHAQYHFISADYMRTIGAPLLSGRWFDARDRRGAQPVILINQAMARKNWPGEDAVGKRIAFGDSTRKDEDWMQVVGVIGDVKDYPNSANSQPAFYLPVTQEPYPEMSLAIRADKDTLSLVEAVRREVRALDREMPISEVRTLETVAAAAVASRRFAMLLVGVFALTALALAGIGIYGVTSYLVAHRTHEIGIRIALGANSFDVLKLALRHGMTLALAGVGAGLALAIAATRLMANLLYGVGATDPATFVAVPLFLIGVSFVACYLPARRATKVDPMTALRRE